MIDDRLFRHPAIGVLHHALRREQRQQLLASLLLSIGGLALTGWAFTQSTLLVILGLGVLMISLRLVFVTGRELRRQEHRALWLLRHHPEQIVWVYSIVTERLPFGVQFLRNGTLYFKLANGDDFSVAMPANQLKMISRYLNRLLPHATFGYSPWRADQYRQHPESLRRPGE